MGLPALMANGSACPPANALADVSATLVVDLDGTLTPTDTLVESVIQLIAKSPLNLFWLFFWLLRGRLFLKNQVASRTLFSPEHLPYREPLLAYLRSEKAIGRRIILATAAHRSIGESVAKHLGLFEAVLATDAGCNLKGQAKLAAIRHHVGDEFVYAGDSLADVPIWKAAKAAVLVGVPSGLANDLRHSVRVEKEFPRERPAITTWLRAMRVHQWLKNGLLFVPLLTAFSFMDTAKLLTMAVAFLAFSLAASSTYLVNDVWDLARDRAHPRKRLRPFASGKLPILHGMMVAVGAMVVAFALALAVSVGFSLMLLAYVVLTSAYSWALKEYVLIDVIMLSLLYILRILAGSVAVDIATSSWLLAFSAFMFLSLALVKRCAELVSMDQLGRTIARGRDYRVTDLVVLWPMGLAAALSAVVVFGLFISAPDTQARYATPGLLWLVAVGLVYWLARLWIKTARGEMHDDPVVYAIANQGSRTTLITLVALLLASRFLVVEFIR